MEQLSEMATSRRTQHRLIAGCGALIILLSAGSALLPVIDPQAGAGLVGLLLFTAGVAEIYAGTLRRTAPGLAMLAGGVTALAGILFAFNRGTHIMGTAVVVTGWLILRSITVSLLGFRSAGSVRAWTLASASMDMLLALLLLIGLSTSTLIVALFGPTSEVIAGFAWILALSFVVTGSTLLEIAAVKADL